MEKYVYAKRRPKKSGLFRPPFHMHAMSLYRSRYYVEFYHFGFLLLCEEDDIYPRIPILRIGDTYSFSAVGTREWILIACISPAIPILLRVTLIIGSRVGKDLQQRVTGKAIEQLPSLERHPVVLSQPIPTVHFDSYTQRDRTLCSTKMPLFRT